MFNSFNTHAMRILSVACVSLVAGCVGSGSGSSTNAAQSSGLSATKNVSVNKSAISQANDNYTSLQFDPSVLTLYIGCPTSTGVCADGHVKIEGVYPDGQKQDITGSNDISLTVDDSNIAGISRDGIVYANAVGATIFHAKSKSLGLSADLPLTVKLALQSIALLGVGSSGSVTFSKAQWLAVSAKGIYVDSSHANLTKLVDWKIADTKIIKYTMEANYIRVDPVSVGSTTLTASLNGVSESVQVNVTN